MQRKKSFSRKEISRRASYRKKKEGLRQLNVWIPIKLVERLKEQALQEEKTLAEFVFEGLNKFLEGENKNL